MKAKRNTWIHNASTGTHFKWLSRNGGILRQDFHGSPPLYKAEYFGDYSFAFPIKGDWVETEQAAAKSLQRLTRTRRSR